MVYEKFWGFSEKPFENTPDHKFFFNSRQHEEGLARMLYVIREGKGAGLLTGIYGCGKTLLSQAILKEIEQDIYKVAVITNPRLDDIELLRMIVYYLSVQRIPTRKADILIALEQVLKNNAADGKRTVVIIDEAHAIEDKNIFEEIRLLLNYQQDNKFLLNLLLIGQPELKENVENIKQLNQRIAMGFHLDGLSREDTKNYIIHRLNIAQASKQIFTDESLSLIYDRSGGIPRRINLICDSALLTGFGKEARIIDKEIVIETIQSLTL
ncbi:MAG: AAA family ATPase [Elusimicrobiota bacterium]